MTEEHKPLTNRWFNLATDVARTYVKTLVLVEERTLDITHSLLHQLEAIQGQGPDLLQEFNTEVQRTRSLVSETLQRTSGIVGSAPRPVRMLGISNKGVKELPAPDNELDDLGSQLSI